MLPQYAGESVERTLQVAALLAEPSAMTSFDDAAALMTTIDGIAASLKQFACFAGAERNSIANEAVASRAEVTALALQRFPHEATRYEVCQ
jgi:hypothetical protein